jgi:hypothetical protein
MVSMPSSFLRDFFLPSPTPCSPYSVVSYLCTIDGVGVRYRARALHFKGAIYHIIDKFLYALCLCRILAVVEDTGMEISVANMTEDACKKPKVIEFLLRDF